MLVLFAGLLPDPTRSVASTSIAFNTYGITYMPFLAESIAVSTRCASSERPLKHWRRRLRLSSLDGLDGNSLSACFAYGIGLGMCRVGNELGAGRPRNARMVVFATLTITPVLWLVIACVLAEPHLQRMLLSFYVDGSDKVLWQTLRMLLSIVAVIELADGLQTVLGGVVQVSLLHALHALPDRVLCKNLYANDPPAILALSKSLPVFLQGNCVGHSLANIPC